MSHQSPADTHPAAGRRRAPVGFLRVILLFGSVAVALGLILIPLLMQQTDRKFMDTVFTRNPFDHTMTGSIKADGSLNMHSASSLSGQ